MRGSIVRNVILGVALGLFLASGLFGAGLFMGRNLPALPFVQAEALPDVPLLEPMFELPAPTSAPPQTEDELFAPFWDAWDIVHREYMDPVNDTELMRGAIRGMLDALGDPHTGYMDPEEFRQANIPLAGQYEGIGAWVDAETDYLTIISPMPGSPAEEAGLQPGDQILAVDGEDMTDIRGDQVIRRVMGPAGSKVVLTIWREDENEIFDVEVTRREIIIPSLESEILEGDIAYVHLFNFGEDTNRDLEAVLEDLLAEDPRGLILDLRGNGGGFLGTAVNVSSEFLSSGLILTERFGDGTEREHEARRGGLATDIPMVVLINGGTASASEIVAGAIQDRDRGELIGTTSFGKGSVQNWIPLSGDGGAVRVTVARWYTPGDRLIDDEGLKPDVVVEIDETDFESDTDPQLEKAIEVLLESLD
jgi:carboxyl-terminal processing protease